VKLPLSAVRAPPLVLEATTCRARASQAVMEAFTPAAAACSLTCSAGRSPSREVKVMANSAALLLPEPGASMLTLTALMAGRACRACSSSTEGVLPGRAASSWAVEFTSRARGSSAVLALP